MALLDEVQTYLVAQNRGTLPGNRQAWPIYLGYMPDDTIAPNSVITLHEVAGAPPEGQWNVIYPRLVVQVRGETDFAYSAARTKMQNIFDTLHNTYDNVTTDYVSVLGQTSAPVFLGYDSKNRPLFMWSFNCIKHAV